MQIIMFQNGQV